MRPVFPLERFAVFPVETPTLPPATHTNTYVVGKTDFFIVEPASPYSAEQLALSAYLQTRLAEGHSCKAILLTHHHMDHVGGVSALQEFLQAPVWGHAKSAERLGYNFERNLEEGDRLDLGDGQIFEVLHTPGHAPGHLCFWDAHAKACIVGDMVAGVGTILIEPTDGNMSQYLHSLRRLRSLDAAMLFPAHGPAIEKTDLVLDYYIAHRLSREAKILEAMQFFKQGASLMDLVPVVYRDTPPELYGIASLSLQSHLEKLITESKIHESGINCYSLSL